MGTITSLSIHNQNRIIPVLSIAYSQSLQRSPAGKSRNDSQRSIALLCKFKHTAGSGQEEPLQCTKQCINQHDKRAAVHDKRTAAFDMLCFRLDKYVGMLHFALQSIISANEIVVFPSDFLVFIPPY